MLSQTTLPLLVLLPPVLVGDLWWFRWRRGHFHPLVIASVGEF